MSVKCPSCGRFAKVRRIEDGVYGLICESEAHNGYVFLTTLVKPKREEP